jgi:hypothetical protein
MQRAKHIYKDNRGVICFDRYFAYLSTLRDRMSHEMFQFATDPARYESQGERTLHDAWLVEFNTTADHSNPTQVARKLSVSLELATHDLELTIYYEGVQELTGSLVPRKRPVRPADLLVHEFSMQPNKLMRHVVEFDQDVWYETVFSTFSYKERGIRRL